MELTVGQLLSATPQFVRNGKNLDIEIGSDVFVAVLTPKKSQPYARAIGTDIKLGRPNNIVTQALLINDIVESVAIYNRSVVNSRFNRRVVLGPQAGITFNDENRFQGDLDATLLYVQEKDLQIRTGSI